MISVLPIVRIISMVAKCYAALVALAAAAIWWWTGKTADGWTIAAWAFSWATGLQVALLLIVHWAWRGIWDLIPKLNEWIFPDLNGKWHITINWHGHVGDGKGTIEGDVTIKLDLLKISMDVVTEKSTSHTLAVTPQCDPESKRPRLVYVFRINPRAVSGPDGIPYRGAAILDHYVEGGQDVLYGKYWTERETVGDYIIRRSNAGFAAHTQCDETKPVA